MLAKEGIRLESMTGISVQGVSDIMALYGAGTSSLCVNGSVDMMGALTGLGGSTYRNYAPYADAPEEGEFDWGGFARNLVMGLAVGAACIAMSLLLPGIGTIAAGALMGAGIGAVSASVAGAVGDYSSGNVRSTEEVIRDVASLDGFRCTDRCNHRRSGSEADISFSKGCRGCRKNPPGRLGEGGTVQYGRRNTGAHGVCSG